MVGLGAVLTACDRPPTEEEITASLRREVDMPPSAAGYTIQNQGMLRARLVGSGRYVLSARTVLCAWSRQTTSYLCRVELTTTNSSGTMETQLIDLHFVKLPNGWAPFTSQ